MNWIEAKIAAATNPQFKMARSLRAKYRIAHKRLLMTAVNVPEIAHTKYVAKQLQYMLQVEKCIAK